MGDIQELWEDVDNGPVQVAQRLLDNKCSLVNVVESLEGLLVHAEPVQRASGVSLLAKVLHKLPSNQLDVDESGFISSFLVDRSKDNFRVIPGVLLCISSVIKQNNLKDAILCRLVKCLYEDIHAQSMVFDDRHRIISIFHYLLETRADSLRTMGSDFLMGFVQSVDSEKEPRCLLLMLKAAYLLVTKLQIDHFVEEIFEIIGCYFPVDFTPPADDNHGITRSVLANTLAVCLTANPLFAEHVVPLALEKLNSDLYQARLDALDLLTRLCATCSAEHMLPHLVELRTNLSRQSLSAASPTQRQATLALVTAVSRLFSGADVADWMHPQIEQCVHLMSQPEEVGMVRPSAELLGALAAGHSSCLYVVLSRALPPLVSQLEVGGDQRWMMAVTFAIAMLLRPDGAENCVLAEKDLRARLSTVALSTLTASSNTPGSVVSLTGLSVLEHAPWLLQDEQANILSEQLIALFLNNGHEQNGELSRVAIQCVTALTKKHPSAVLNNLIRPIVSQLVNADSSETTDNQLRLLTASVLNLEAVRESLPLLFVRLIRVSRISADTTVQTLKAMETIIRQTCDLPAVLSYLIDDFKLPEKLLDLYGSAACEITINSSRPLVEVDSALPLHATAVVEAGGTVLSVICRALTTPVLDQFLESCVSLYLQDDGAPLLTSLGAKWQSLAPLLHQAPWQHTQLVVLLTSVLGTAQCSAKIPRLSTLAVLLTKMALKKQHRASSSWSALLLAVIVNKLPASETAGILEKIASQLEFLWEKAESLEDRMPVLRLWTAVSKGLLLAGHSQCAQFTDRLLTWLDNEAASDAVVDAFAQLIADDTFLSRLNHCRVRLLHRQWLFTTAWPRLSAGLLGGTAAGPGAAPRLRVLGLLLSALPAAAVSDQLPELLPLLAAGLQQLPEDAALGGTCLQLLARTAADQPSVLEPHVDTLVPRLLLVARTAGQLTQRCEALRCLQHLATLRVHLLLPLRSDLLERMQPCLGDKKRLVRQQAVEARNAWFLVGAPGGRK